MSLPGQFDRAFFLTIPFGHYSFQELSFRGGLDQVVAWASRSWFTGKMPVLRFAAPILLMNLTFTPKTDPRVVLGFGFI